MKINLPPLFEQTIQGIIHSSNECELFNELLTAVQILEFDYYAYGVRIAYPVTKPTFLLKNNYTDKWQSRYTNKNYIDIDPTVKHGLNSTHPIVWNNKLLQDQSEFWEEAYSNGLKYGWAQSSILNASSIGMLTVARETESENLEKLSYNQPLLIWLNNVFKSTYAEIILPDTLKPAYSALTLREAEMLKWCADGKTSNEIAMILSVKKRTVDFHIANAIAKLNVSNKTAAAVRAIQLNII